MEKIIFLRLIRLLKSGCNLIELESIENQFSFIKDKNILSLNVDDIEMKLKNYDFIETAKLIKFIPLQLLLILLKSLQLEFINTIIIIY